VGSLLVVACGSAVTSNESRLNERSTTVQPQGEPDWKNKDGVEIITWAKRPEVRKAICNTLRDAHKQGFSATSSEAFKMVAKAFELHPVEAEIVAVYAADMECPELN
ncbi:MAG: hypothetical protein RI932_1460, partial [Pseudomonadota bacterium]